MEMPTVFELANIGISRTKKEEHGGTRYAYTPFVVISSRNGELIELLHQQYPYSYTYIDTTGQTPIYVLEIKGKNNIKELLSEILPYTISYRERWEALWEYVNISRATPEEAEYYRSIINRR